MSENQIKRFHKFFASNSVNESGVTNNYKKRKRIRNLAQRYSNEIPGHNELVQIRDVKKI